MDHIRTVLDVDDHASARFARTRILQRAGFGVDEADLESLLNLSARGSRGRSLPAFFTDNRPKLMAELIRAVDGLIIDRMGTLQPRARRPVRVHLDVSPLPPEPGERLQVRWVLTRDAP